MEKALVSEKQSRAEQSSAFTRPWFSLDSAVFAALAVLRVFVVSVKD